MSIPFCKFELENSTKEKNGNFFIAKDSFQLEFDFFEN